MSIFRAMHLKSMQQKDLIEHARKFPPAFRLKTDKCENCGLCCKNGPGDLGPDDVTRIAKHLGLSESDFVQTYCVVGISADLGLDGDDLILVLRRENWRGNSFVSNDQSFDTEPCVFRVEGRCQLHEVKPRICASHQCWIEDQELIHNTWTKEQLRAVGYTGPLEEYDDDYEFV